MHKFLQAAEMLFQRRQITQPGARLPEHLQPQTLAEGWQMQKTLGQLLLAKGDTVAGWKCALPKDQNWVLAPIYGSSLVDAQAPLNQPCPLLPRQGAAGVEPEFAFKIGSDLPPRAHNYSEVEIDCALASTHMALELIADRFTQPGALSFYEKMADHFFNQGLVVGPAITESPAQLDLRYRYEHEHFAQRGKHPDGFAKAPLYWLVNFLRAQGIALEAGQFIITGSLAGVWSLPLNKHLTIEYLNLGQFSLEFTARSGAMLDFDSD